MSIKNAVMRYFIRQNKFYNIASVTIRSNKHEWREEQSRNDRKYEKVAATGLFTSVVLGFSIIGHAENKGNVTNGKDKKDDKTFEAGEKRPDLPTYTAEDVSKHNKTNDFWVTYKNGVYDITSFLPSHPGGDQILNAAGFSIEPFWNVYGMHKTEDIFRLLEQYRIGNLHENDIVDHSDDELWVREPRRDPRLIVKTERPFNAETPAKYLVEHFDTPNELFYVRQHMPVPELDANKHKVKVVVEGSRKVHQFSLKDLDRFKQTTLRAALMCAGNRRIEMDKQVKPVKGISWNSGAISNAVWTGVLLRDVLLYCGVDERDLEGKHVILQGADIDATGTNFSTSIPLHMAMNPNNSILLATHMNGEPLPPDHGRPLRAVVPGAPAVRSVKWLESITVSTSESCSHWHQKDYRAFNPSKTWETADFSTAPPVYSLPVTSAICDPLDGDTVEVKSGCITVKGYAYSGGGAQILRVDVSADRGRSWAEAALVRDCAPPQRHHAWTLWEANLPVTARHREVELWVKATDSNFNTQPENFNDIWNIRGILSNAYHKIKVQLKR